MTDTSKYFKAPGSETTYTDYDSYTHNIGGATPVAQTANTYAQPATSPTPVNTSQPQPTPTNPLPTVNPQEQATPITPPTQIAPGINYGAGVNFTPNPIKQAFEATKNTPPPQTQGEAASTVSGAINTANSGMPPDTSNIDALLAQDKGYNQLLADRMEYNNTANQSKSLLDFYNQSVTDAGIPGINAELLNSKKIIEGTEDDIRNEVKSVSGFATDSQIMALSSARNKSLIKNYNALLDHKAMAMESINNMVNLASQDREFALQTIQQKMQFDQQIIEYRDKFIKNAAEGYKNVINAIGYDGLLKSLMASDPTGHSVALAEKTLGFQSGQLQQIVTQHQAQTNLTNLKDYNVTSPYVITASGEVQNSQNGEAYSSPQDFQAKTGMTLDQAGQKGLLKRLGQSISKQKDQLDMDVKRSQISENNAQTAKIYHDINSAPDRQTQIVDLGNGHKQLIDSNTGAVIQDYKSGDTPNAPMQQAQSKAQIDQIGNILNSGNLKTSVGPNAFSRINDEFKWYNPTTWRSVATPGASNFIADVEQLRSQLNLDALIKAKGQGATFGSLSDQELRVLSSSATKLGTWAIKDRSGNIIGYNAKESDFRKELDKIGSFAKLDYILKGGNPNDVGVTQDARGNWATQNSDGSGTEFPELKGYSPSFNPVGNTKDSMREFEPKTALGQLPHIEPMGQLATKNPAPFGIVAGYDITNYATDPTHEKKVYDIYQKMQKLGTINDPTSLQAYIQYKVKNSPIKGNDVYDAAKQFGVDPLLVISLMQQDSAIGTTGKAVKTRNPGNVGNTDSGGTQVFKSWRDGVFAVAKNLSKRKVKVNA